jgi:hypothetical protein
VYKAMQRVTVQVGLLCTTCWSLLQDVGCYHYSAAGTVQGHAAGVSAGGWDVLFMCYCCYNMLLRDVLLVSGEAERLTVYKAMQRVPVQVGGTCYICVIVVIKCH